MGNPFDPPLGNIMTPDPISIHLLQEPILSYNGLVYVYGLMCLTNNFRVSQKRHNIKMFSLIYKENYTNYIYCYQSAVRSEVLRCVL